MKPSPVEITTTSELATLGEGLHEIYGAPTFKVRVSVPRLAFKGGDTMHKTGQSTELEIVERVVEFAHKYYNRNLDTSRPGEVLMSYLIGRCEHYSENAAGDGPGDKCELCDGPTPIRRDGHAAEKPAKVSEKIHTECPTVTIKGEIPGGKP